MQSVVAPDIFGHTPHLDDLCSLAGCDYQVVCPYDGNAPEFESEADAYREFMQSVGLDRYVQKLQSAMEVIQVPSVLVGFSVGASAVWRLCGGKVPKDITRAVCFYGSQIRHDTELQPTIPLALIIPRFEPTFDVTELSRALSVKPLVDVEITDERHGFMNPLSVNFDQATHDRFASRILEYCDERRSD